MEANGGGANLGNSDSDIWARVLSGEGRAFGELWGRHRDRVFRHARHLLAHHADAEDATAMAFLELWRRRQDARVVDGSLLPWLLVVTTNVVRNASRSRRRYRALLARLPDPEPVRDAGELIADQAEARTRLAGFTRLSAADQQIIALVAFDDLPLEDAAAALGISYGAAKTRLSRARARLEEHHE
ncbi:MAG: sigma-70 family RNA polymerase sigma factor [Pseudolysinimonas sp.]